jgi:hypothetical protein
MNLYKARNSQGDVFFTVADNYNDVAQKIEAWLNEKDWFYPSQRKMVSIELVAEPTPSNLTSGRVIYYFVDSNIRYAPGQSSKSPETDIYTR